jgi:lysozyme family protein
MTKPPWFVAALLGAFAALLVAHLGMLGFGASRCANYGAELGARLARSPVGSPAAQAAHDKHMESAIKCMRLIDDFQKASDNYQSTILALLGGAGLSVGVGVSNKKRPEETPPAADRRDEP